jgi:hypothetical protein
MKFVDPDSRGSKAHVDASDRMQPLTVSLGQEDVCEFGCVGEYTIVQHVNKIAAIMRLVSRLFNWGLLYLRNRKTSLKAHKSKAGGL